MDGMFLPILIAVITILLVRHALAGGHPRR